MHRLFYILMLLLGGVLVSFPSANADDDADGVAKEYQVKVAFLYNFVKFVEWPGAQSLAQTHAANICIIGDDPFGATLNIFKQASTPQLALNVKRNITDSDIPNCHILFISKSEGPRLPRILALAQSHSVLTVSELSGFADNGGIVEMVKVAKSIGLFSKDKINLRINMKTADEERLHIDAQLLEIAAEVIK